MFAEPATMGWWRGQPGTASTPFTEGLGRSQGDKYPFSLSEESVSSEMLEKRALRIYLTVAPSDLLRGSNKSN